ncbi:MAG: glycosyltransferase family 2 protein [Planctomycetaceae bacterium]
MNPPESPQLSVLIPVYNGARYLAQTLDSVLSQEGVSPEIIVVDDGSTDDSVSVAQSFAPRVRTVGRPHAGLAATRNAALREARGDFIAHLDQDDLLTPRSLSVRLQRLLADLQLDMVAGHQQSFFSEDIDPAVRSRLQISQGPQPGHVAGVAIIRARVFDQLGGFDESLQSFGDLDWSMRATEAGIRTEVLPDVVLLRRVHGANMSLTKKAQADLERARLLKASLDRRRGRRPGGSA